MHASDDGRFLNLSFLNTVDGWLLHAAELAPLLSSPLLTSLS